MGLLSPASTAAERKSPFRLFIRDACTLFTSLPYLPWLFLPFWTDDPTAELFISAGNVRDMALQVLLFLLETVLLVLAVPAILVLPGAICAALSAVVGVLVLLLTKPMDGPTVVQSQTDENVVESAGSHEKERWVFVNGCATSHKGLQANVDLLAATFGRPVVGIHNKSFGLPFDLVECIIQRAFSYNTLDARVALDHIKAYLCDPEVHKVVLVGHSQGAIIISMVIDELLNVLPQEVVSKVEVYTFGSAASHFNNPSISYANAFQSSSATPDKKAGKLCIQHIEHYCNEYDMVSRWGALDNARNQVENPYSGKVFVRLGATGHMFNQHYLSVLFPLPTSPSTITDPEPTVNGFTAALMTWGRSIESDVRLSRFSRLWRYVGGKSPDA